MKVLASIVFVCFIALTVGQLPYEYFTATFSVTASPYNNGYFSGEMFYDWTENRMLLQFPLAGQYAELYLFNADNGFPGLANGQFSSQYLYKNSSVCSCETVTLSYSMPPLFLGTPPTPSGVGAIVSSSWTSAGSTQQFPLGLCTLYTDSQVYALASSAWFLPSGEPCGFELQDGRTFSFTEITDMGQPDSSHFDPPTNCKCGKPLDLVISLDRTGSIQNWEWTIEHQFTQNLSLAFEYGPLATNMGIIDWNSVSWTTIALTDGTSLSSVETAIDNMGCCGNPPATGATDSCCCCGTPIGGGLYLAGQMMATSLRPTATKVIILVTDGCQNHMFDASTNPPTVTACVCSGTTEQSCETNLACVQDIDTYYQYVTNTIPGVRIIAVGVGGPTTICTQQLLQVAGGIEQNVYNPTSWGQLSGIVEALSATACSSNETACVDCCGICSCGQCILPSSCSATNKCNVGVIDPNSGCCTTAPTTCTPIDSCHTVTCDPILGCVNKNVTCPVGNQCTSFNCNLGTGMCDMTVSDSGVCNTTVPGYKAPPPFCNATNGAVKCNDSNDCTVDTCVNDACVYTAVVCPKSDSCTTWTCAPASGCVFVNKTCNDNNPCTTDTCNTKTGCVYTNVVCPVPSDPCKVVSCQKNLGGCFISAQTCSNMTAKNCSVPACNKTCGYANVCLPPPPFTGSEVTLTEVLGSAIGGAALVAIVVAAVVVALGVAGGGAYAAYGGGGLGGAASTQNNPLYQPTGLAGHNPLFKV